MGKITNVDQNALHIYLANNEKVSEKVLHFLIEKNANLTSEDRFQKSPLFYGFFNNSVHLNHFKIFEKYLDSSSFDTHQIFYFFDTFFQINFPLDKFFCPLLNFDYHSSSKSNLFHHLALSNRIDKCELEKIFLFFFAENFFSCRQKFFEEKLIEKNIYNYTPLHYLASKKGNLTEKILNLFIEKKIYLNSKNENNETPLHLYCYHNKKVEIKVIKMFLENKSDVNILDNENNSPLLYLFQHFFDYQYFLLFSSYSFDPLLVIGKENLFFKKFDIKKNVKKKKIFFLQNQLQKFFEHKEFDFISIFPPQFLSYPTVSKENLTKILHEKKNLEKFDSFFNFSSLKFICKNPNCDESIFKIILDSPIYPTCILDYKNSNFLHFFSSHFSLYHEQTIKQFILLIDINQRDRNNKTPLDLTIAK